MDRLLDLVRQILLDRFDEIAKVVVHEFLDELIEGVLETWQRNPEIAFEELRAIVIGKLHQLKNEGKQ